MGQIYKVLGEKKAIAIVGKQLVEILIAGDIANTSKKAVSKASSMIIAKYSFLKLSELMLFVARFNAGEFDKLYNKFDTTAIMRSLSMFMEQREQDIAYYTDRDIPQGEKVCPSGFTPYRFYMEACRAKKNGDKEFINKYKKYL